MTLSISEPGDVHKHENVRSLGNGAPRPPGFTCQSPGHSKISLCRGSLGDLLGHTLMTCRDAREHPTITPSTLKCALACLIDFVVFASNVPLITRLLK